jgi:hypothetical protein
VVARMLQQLSGVSMADIEEHARKQLG